MSVESIGILVDGDTLRGWQVNSLAHLVREKDVEIEYIIQNSEGGSLTQNLKQAYSMGVWGGYVAALEAYWRLSSYPSGRSPHQISELYFLKNAKVFECEPIPATVLGNRLPESAICRLDEVDVGVRFGFGILKGEALSAPSHGVLSYHHGDFREYRGRPAGFWEFMHGKEEAGVTVQKLSEQLDAGEVAAFTKVDITGAKSWLEVRRQLYEASTPLLTKAVEAIERDETYEVDSLGDLYTDPTLTETVKYFSQLLRSRVGQG